MQKRDKSGRFLKGKVSKKKKKTLWLKPMPMPLVNGKHVKVKIQKPKKIKDISDLTLWDLKDMISAEVALQMRY